MGRGYSGLFQGTKGAKDYERRQKRIVTINADKQNRHIVGKGHDGSRSVFFGTVDDAQKLVNGYSGKGSIVFGGPKERINFQRIIGEYYSPLLGKYIPTTWGIIHYSKTGCHIVPSAPKGDKK